MGNRKKKYTPKSFESSKGSGDVSANIYNSMFESRSWNSLTKVQMILYLYMKRQYYGARGVEESIVHGKPPTEAFYFNKGMWKERYGLYTNQKSFYKDRDVLIEKGFIEIFENGQSTKTKNIYVFSDKWRNDS